ncbi:MAG TPA: hypothetical protein VKT81_07930 [Bryobacteraceae bacterium]|nr:hypothetical protein [Bryobacteraceae bacterium]
MKRLIGKGSKIFPKTRVLVRITNAGQKFLPDGSNESRALVADQVRQ